MLAQKQIAVSDLETFPELVSGHQFDRYQTGLISRWRARSIGYELTYGTPTAKSAMWLDFTTDQAIGRVTLWESGECDMEVIDCATGGDILREHFDFKSSEEFFATYPKVPLLLLRLRGDRIHESNKS